MQKEIGKMGVKIVRDIVEPIKRTGGFERSWKYKIGSDGDSVSIYSDHKAASSLQRGINYVGSTQSLVAWLRTKKEHKGKSESELNRFAFNIKRKIDRGDSPGDGSTLKTLAPQGERRFDYLAEASNQISEELDTFFGSM